MQYKITPGLECLFVEAKAKAKKEKKDKDELVVESAEEIVPTVPVAGTPTSKDEIIKLLDTDINAAAEAYTKLEDDTEKAAIRAAIAQKAAIEKNFDDAVKRFTDAQQTVEEEKQEKQEIANPTDNNTLPDSDSNLGNADQDYEPADVAPSVGGDINNAESTGTDFSAPVTACVKEQLVVEAEYHLKHGLDKKAYLNTVNTIYNDSTVTKEASVIFDNAVKAKQPATLTKTAEKMDMFLQAAAAYREHKPDYEGYLKTAAESTSGEEWLRKIAGINKKAYNNDNDDEAIFTEEFIENADEDDDADINNKLKLSDEEEDFDINNFERWKQEYGGIHKDEVVLPSERFNKHRPVSPDNYTDDIFVDIDTDEDINTPITNDLDTSQDNASGKNETFSEYITNTSKYIDDVIANGDSKEMNRIYHELSKQNSEASTILYNKYKDKLLSNPVKSQKSITGLLKTAAPLNEAPANNKKYPGQNLFTNGKSTQENGNTPEDFPGNKLFDETNKAVETVFPEGQVTQDQIIKDRTIIKDLSKIKDINDQTIAIMQPIKVEPVNLGDSAENNMKDFFFNGNNVVRSPEPSKTLPAGKPAHKVDDVIVSMDELSKKAK